MTVGDFCLKETSHSEVAFLIAFVRIFIRVGTMTAAFLPPNKLERTE